jgi:hypothetical protein
MNQQFHWNDFLNYETEWADTRRRINAPITIWAAIELKRWTVKDI